LLLERGCSVLCHRGNGSKSRFSADGRACDCRGSGAHRHAPTGIGGLEFAVYWFGLTLFLYAAGIGLVTSTFFRATELGAFFEVRPRRAPGILLLSATASGLAILAWRNWRLSRPELAVYLLGIAYWIYVWIRLVQE
jgi:hypothetical protein